MGLFQQRSLLRQRSLLGQRLKGYGGALLFTAAATFTTQIGGRIFEAPGPFLFHTGAVVAAAWLGGLGPGLFAAGLATASIDYFFLKPTGFDLAFNHSCLLGCFLLQSTAIAALMERQHRYRVELETAAREAERVRSVVERSAQELELVSRRKDDFIAVVAHELRNLVQPIMMRVRLAEQKPGDGAVLLALRETVSRQAGHIVRLIDSLLDSSRIARGAVRLDYEPLDLVALVREVMEEQRLRLEEKDLELVLELPEEPVPIVGDQTRLVQVVSNLVGNAVKFTPAGGQVTVRVEAAPQAWNAQLSVADTGVGIDPEWLPRIFDAYVQDPENLARGKRGLGLGLSVVRSLVELHGGTVEAHSEGRDQGACFCCHLPLALPNRPTRCARVPDKEDRGDGHHRAWWEESRGVGADPGVDRYPADERPAGPGFA